MPDTKKPCSAAAKSRVLAFVTVLCALWPLSEACRDSGSTAAAAAADSGSPGAAAAPERLHWIGRLDVRDPAGPRLSWPGTTVEAVFTGTGIDVRLRDSGTSFFSVVIDAKTPTVLSTSSATGRYALASNLPAGRHTVALSKRTEASVGVVQFLGLSPREGTLVEAPWPAKPRRIEFIGDSITCGYGDRGADPEQHFSPALEDETIAYGALAAQALGAEHTAIAYSGIGVLRDRRGNTREQMPARFERALADDITSGPVAATAPPDAVVINLGTNDFALGDPGPSFRRAYVRLVHAVRSRYRGAWIVCALGPSLTDSYPPNAMSRTKASAAIRSVVEELTSEGERRVVAFAFAEQQLSDGFGSDYHPSARTHERMADELTAALRPLLGW